MNTGPRIPRLADARRMPPGGALLQLQPKADVAGTDANAGTLDPTVCSMLRGAARVGELASAPEHYQAGYIDGHRTGRWQTGLAGFIAGMLFVVAFIQLGLWVGPLP